MLGRATEVLRKVANQVELRRSPVDWARRQGVIVGNNCRLLGLSTATFGSEPYLIRLGDHVTVTEGVRFITHDGGVWVFRQEEPELDVFGAITVGNNVFIGLRALVLPGVKIGENCVIGAGSVVTRSVPANSVALGVPARVTSTVDEYRNRLRGREHFIRSQDTDAKKKILSALRERDKDR